MTSRSSEQPSAEALAEFLMVMTFRYLSETGFIDNTDGGDDNGESGHVEEFIPLGGGISQHSVDELRPLRLLADALHANMLRPSMLDFLETKGDLINESCNDENLSLLVTAVTENNIQVVRELIRVGADLNLHETGRWALEYAVCSNVSKGTEMVELLIEMGIDINPSIQATSHLPILQACAHSLTEIFFLLVAHGANIHVHETCGHTALMCATMKNNIIIAQALLDMGVDINETNPQSDNVTALFVAAYEGSLKMVRFLVSNGVDENVQTTRGGTPTYFAMRNGHQDVVRFLSRNDQPQPKRKKVVAKRR